MSRTTGTALISKDRYSIIKLQSQIALWNSVNQNQPQNPPGKECDRLRWNMYISSVGILVGICVPLGLGDHSP